MRKAARKEKEEEEEKNTNSITFFFFKPSSEADDSRQLSLVTRLCIQNNLEKILKPRSIFAVQCYGAAGTALIYDTSTIYECLLLSVEIFFFSRLKIPVREASTWRIVIELSSDKIIVTLMFVELNIIPWWDT